MAIYPPHTVTLRNGAAVELFSPREEHAQELIEYLDAIRRETRFILFDPGDKLPTLDEEVAWVRRSYDHHGSLKIAARPVAVDGKTPSIVALCDVSAGRQVRLRHVGAIGISIRAAWCDRGLGSILMGELVAFGLNHPELTVLELGVLAHNTRAIRVYEKHGFTRDGMRPRHVRYPDGAYGDEILMSRWVGGAAWT